MSAQFRGDRVEALRVPPHAVESEQSVIGGLMLAPQSLVEVSDWLAPEDFYRTDHRLIYQAIRDLAGKQQPFDVVTLGEWFEANGLADKIGGSAYLIELASTTPSAANIVAYAEIVVGKARLRSAIEIGTTLVNDGFRPDGRDVAEIVQCAHHRLMQLAPSPRTGPKTTAAVLTSLYADLQRRYDAKAMPGQPSPWHEINKITHGFQDGETYLIAARTNTGKSLAGFQVGAFNALRGNRTLVFSLEMTAEAVVRRTVSALCNIPHDWLLQPSDEAGDYWPSVTEAFRQLHTAPLLIDDAPMLNAAQIAARAQRAHLQESVRMIIVDHLHDMALPGKQGEVIERAMALRELKALGKMLHCPVIVLAQLNRNSDTENRRPALRDLRGSGGIEEVADVVLFLHAADDLPGVVEVIVGKGRDICTGGSIYLQAKKDVMRLDDWTGPLPTREPVESQVKQQTRQRWSGVPQGDRFADKRAGT